MQEFPADWQEPIDLRPRYRVCRVAFVLSALAHGLLGADGLCHVFTFLSGDWNLFQVFESPYWDWLVGAPITWGSVLASYLLIGRFPDSRWRRRAWLLAAMNSADLIQWSLDHAEILGLPAGLGGGGRSILSMVMGPLTNLAELILSADLAGELMGHLGHRDEATPRIQAARMVAGIALMLWALLQMNLWDLQIGRVPQLRRMRGDAFNLFLGSLGAQAITAMIVAFLCLRAGLICNEVLVAIDRHDHDNDPFADGPESRSPRK